MRRLIAILAGLLVLIIGGVLSTDGLQRSAGQAAVAADLRDSVPLSGTPRVLIDGFPFAWFALRGSFPAVAVIADGMPMEIGETSVQFDDVDLVLERVQRDDGTITAESLVGGATLGWVDLSELAGVPATSGGAGKVSFRHSYTAEVGLPALVAVVTGVPVVDAAEQTVTLADAEVSVAGVALGPEASQALLGSLLKPVAIKLAHGLTMVGVTATDAGLALEVAGTDVVFPAR